MQQITQMAEGPSDVSAETVAILDNTNSTRSNERAYELLVIDSK
jgi:hypothetical protein